MYGTVPATEPVLWLRYVLGRTEVDDFDPWIAVDGLEHDVIGLEVAMDQSRVMDHVQREQNLAHDVVNDCGRERLSLSLVDLARECAHRG